MIINLDFNGLVSGIGDIAYYVPNAGYGPIRQLMGESYRSHYALPFVRYYGMFDIYTKLYLNNKLEFTKVSNKGAALEKNSISQEYSNTLVKSVLKQKIEATVNDTVCNDVLDLVKAYPERRFIFVSAPYHSSFIKALTNYPDVERFLLNLSAQKNVKYLDFSRLPMPDNMFMNTSHINYKGAIYFSGVPKDSLKNISW